MTTKTVKTNTVKYTKQEQIAIKVASAIAEVGAIQSGIDAWCQELHKLLKGKKLGTVKTGDAVMVRFTETLEQAGKAEQTVKNYATAFRKAVNEGVPFSMNAYRAKGKKGAKTEKSDEAQAIVKLTIVKDSTADQVAQGLRQVFEAKREQYAELVSFLIDALDEYDGK
jgi:hypothetical protein